MSQTTHNVTFVITCIPLFGNLRLFVAHRRTDSALSALCAPGAPSSARTLRAGALKLDARLCAHRHGTPIFAYGSLRSSLGCAFGAMIH